MNSYNKKLNVVEKVLEIKKNRLLEKSFMVYCGSRNISQSTLRTCAVAEKILLISAKK